MGGWAVSVALPQPRATFSTTTNVVVVNVTVLDRNNKPIDTLSKDDFQVFEDGKPQKLQAVDFQRLTNALLPPIDAPAPAAPKGYNPGGRKAALQDHAWFRSTRTGG